MRKLICCLLLLLPASGLYAQSGGTSFEFMLIGASARAAAMAEAFTAVGGDASSPYFNPAALGLDTGTELALSHFSYFNDVTQQAFNLTFGPRKFRSGIAAYYGAVNDIQRRANNPTDDPLGTFDEHNFQLAYIWSIPLGDKMAIGNTVKWAYEKIDIEDASALALDIGGVYSINSNLNAGLSLRNLGTKPKFINETFDLPLELRLGASYRLPIRSDVSSCLTAVDLVFPNWGDKSVKFNLGAEYTYQKLIILRTGYGFGYESRGFAIGMGLTYRGNFFDYSYVPSKHNLSDINRFTLRVRI